MVKPQKSIMWHHAHFFFLFIILWGIGELSFADTDADISVMQ